MEFVHVLQPQRTNKENNSGARYWRESVTNIVYIGDDSKRYDSGWGCYHAALHYRDHQHHHILMCVCVCYLLN
jgi:hypothetical protein